MNNNCNCTVINVKNYPNKPHLYQKTYNNLLVDRKYFLLIEIKNIYTIIICVCVLTIPWWRENSSSVVVINDISSMRDTRDVHLIGYCCPGIDSVPKTEHT